MPWKLSTYTDLAFDGLTGTEYPIAIDCALNSETGETLNFAELVIYINDLEQQTFALHQPTDDSSHPTDKHVQHIRAILQQAGIDWNKKTARLAHCEWVTEAYIEAHVTAVEFRNIGLAINRMLIGDPPPQELLFARYPQIKR